MYAQGILGMSKIILKYAVFPSLSLSIPGHVSRDSPEYGRETENQMKYKMLNNQKSMLLYKS